MNEEVQVQKKGMSKGCLIGLIVAAVVVVMIIIAIVIFWIYKDDVVKFGASTVITSIRTEVSKNPPAGVDTASFFAVCDAFSEKLQTDTVAAEQFQAFFTDAQAIMSDSKVDSAEVEMLLGSMYGMYPELEEEVPYGVPEEPMESIDTLETTSE